MAPEILSTLVERFERNLESYRSGAYNETQVRNEFINPFFEALGWDVQNKLGYAEAYKDVIHEDAVKIGTATKAPDYSFRIGGVRKFFLEAKKPSVNIAEEISPAYQLRRYAWSANLPLSILTDFEEFAVYDCRTKPKPTDKASIGRMMYLKFSTYEEKWDEIANIFSKDAVMKGSFDKYAQKGGRGTAQVDKEFLREIENWREELAKNIALRNKDLSVRDLNFSVQRIIDRIIFLRMCEDRGIEIYGKLQQLMNGQNTYARLRQFFDEADAKYNSGLFHFRKEKDRHEPPDELTPSLTIDDKVLKSIIGSLYYPASPYEFSVLGADILGNVYEQFLGKVIRLTPSHQAKVEDKPEVKKAGGVYYTPKYIVDYIVKNTVGKLCDGKTPKEVSKLRILDPACGSGSFLIGAYQYLLDWHRDWYVNDGVTKHTKVIYQAAGSEWRLTTVERKRILLNNIYGVDIDTQAVETTKLSLLLKVLEGENEQTLSKQFKLFHERALPDLGNNIKCGNSLIGPDYYEGQIDMLDDEERYRINAFDWKSEFKSIMNAGGFDAVIGNPPYLFITELDQHQKDYFFKRYATSEYRFDVYGLFIELGITHLLGKGALISFIIPHTILSNDSFEKLRKLVLQKTSLIEVVDIGPGIFEKAKNETMIFVLQNIEVTGSIHSTKIVLTNSNAFLREFRVFSIDQRQWLKNNKASWLVKVSDQENSILIKIKRSSIHLGDLCTINQGLRTGDNAKYLSSSKKSGKWKPVVGGIDVGRYEPLTEGKFVYYEPEELDAPRRKEIFQSNEKIVIQEIRNITLQRRLIATYDNEKFYCLQSTNVINLREEHRNRWNLLILLGILNSTLVNFFFRNSFSGNNHIASNQLSKIPLPDHTTFNPKPLTLLVEQMLSHHKKLATANTAHDKALLQRQINATDNQIDKLVYELYCLTEEEVKIVEGV